MVQDAAVVHLTLAIADFMGILIVAAFWSAASLGGVAIACLVAAGATVWGLRRLLRR